MLLLLQTLKQEAEEGAFKGVLERTQEAKKRREARIAALRAEKEEREGMKKFVAKPVPKNVLAAPRRQYVTIDCPPRPQPPSCLLVTNSRASLLHQRVDC